MPQLDIEPQNIIELQGSLKLKNKHELCTLSQLKSMFLLLMTSLKTNQALANMSQNVVASAAPGSRAELSLQWDMHASWPTNVLHTIPVNSIASADCACFGSRNK